VITRPAPIAKNPFKQNKIIPKNKKQPFRVNRQSSASRLGVPPRKSCRPTQRTLRWPAVPPRTRRKLYALQSHLKQFFELLFRAGHATHGKLGSTAQKFLAANNFSKLHRRGSEDGLAGAHLMDFEEICAEWRWGGHAADY
jgi:hypothetical protein